MSARGRSGPALHWREISREGRVDHALALAALLFWELSDLR